MFFPRQRHSGCVGSAGRASGWRVGPQEPANNGRWAAWAKLCSLFDICWEEMDSSFAFSPSQDPDCLFPLSCILIDFLGILYFFFISRIGADTPGRGSRSFHVQVTERSQLGSEMHHAHF